MIVMSWFELVQTLIQTIPFPMDIVDEKGTILFQNDVFKKIFGEEAIGKKCWELYQDDKKQCEHCPLQHEIKIGINEIHTCYGTLGGKIYDIHHTGMMFNGKKAMLEIFMDITDRRELQDEIKKSEEEFRKLFGNMEQGFAVHEVVYNEKGDPIDYRYIMVNEAFESLTGLKGVDIIGKTIKEVVPDVEEYWVTNFGKVAKTGESGQFEDFFGHSKKYFNVTAYSPKQDFFAVIFYDVTKYKKDEKKLADKRKFIDSVLNVCPSVIYVYDIIKKKNVYSNKGIEDILGYTCDEIAAMGSDMVENLMHPKDYTIYINETIPKYKRKRSKPLKHTYRMKHKNGKWIRLIATEVVYSVDENGKPKEIIGNIIRQ